MAPDRALGGSGGRGRPVAVRDSTTGTTTIEATLNSNPSHSYAIQCFLTEAGGDPSGHGEGKTLLDTTTTETDANGESPAFSCTSDVPAEGDSVTMTATKFDTSTSPATPTDTSEFSENVVVTSGT